MIKIKGLLQSPLADKYISVLRLELLLGEHADGLDACGVEGAVAVGVGSTSAEASTESDRPCPSYKSRMLNGLWVN